jgi:integrase
MAREAVSVANSSGRRAAFGNTRRLPSRRYQARYTGPDGQLHTAPTTFDTKGDAEAWLATKRADIVRDSWVPDTRGKAITFGVYSDAWLDGRRVKGKPLAARTRAHYRTLLDAHILPTFKNVQLRHITPEMVDDWYAVTAVGRPTLQAHAYALPELEAIANAMPDRYRAMVVLAAWCALRFGELAELRRDDVDTKTGVIHVRRGVVRVVGETIVKAPKTAAGIRDVAIPPHLVPLVREHLLQYTEPGKDGLLFPARGGGHLRPSTLYRVYYPARQAAGRPDLAFHHLRHTGAVLAAQTGATLAELMARLGHSTPAAAMRYQSAAEERDLEIARRLSAMVTEAEDA